MDNTTPMLTSMPSTLGSSGGKKTSVFLIILAVVVLALIIWWVRRAPEEEQGIVSAPTPTPVAQDEIQQEAEQLDLGDLDREFNPIDQDLNTL